MRALWFLVGGAGAALAGVQLYEQQQLGFPDGHISELERALRWPHLGLASLCRVVAAGLLWPGERERGPLAAILVLLLAADWVGLPMLGEALGLEHGQGG